MNEIYEIPQEVYVTEFRRHYVSTGEDFVGVCIECGHYQFWRTKVDLKGEMIIVTGCAKCQHPVLEEDMHFIPVDRVGKYKGG